MVARRGDLPAAGFGGSEMREEGRDASEYKSGRATDTLTVQRVGPSACTFPIRQQNASQNLSYYYFSGHKQKTLYYYGPD